MAKLILKRGTRAQVDAAATASGLTAGEPYLITDQNRLAVGLSATTYAAMTAETDPILAQARLLAAAAFGAL